VAAGCWVRLKGYVNGVQPVQRRCPDPFGTSRLERGDRESGGDEEVVTLVELAHPAAEFHAGVHRRQIVQGGQTRACRADLP
jgi:hypothetical protein